MRRRGQPPSCATIHMVAPSTLSSRAWAHVDSTRQRQLAHLVGRSQHTARRPGHRSQHPSTARGHRHRVRPRQPMRRCSSCASPPGATFASRTATWVSERLVDSQHPRRHQPHAGRHVRRGGPDRSTVRRGPRRVVGTSGRGVHRRGQRRRRHARGGPHGAGTRTHLAAGQGRFPVRHRNGLLPGRHPARRRRDPQHRSPLHCTAIRGNPQILIGRLLSFEPFRWRQRRGCRPNGGPGHLRSVLQRPGERSRLHGQHPG